MKALNVRTCVALAALLASLSACTSHCTCPPPPATTVIHEDR